MSIVLTTPTGHIGSRTVERLLEAGADDITVLVRDPAKLPENVHGRVTVQQGNLEDGDFVRAATRNADALLWVTPPNYSATNVRALYQRFADNVSEAVRANQISHVVNISSAGAHQAQGLGPVSFLQLIENRLNETGANVLHLRPGNFMENFLFQLDALRHQGSVYLPAPGDVPYPMIATRDIGDVVAARLQDRSWTGQQIHGLHGPADLSYNQAVAILSDVLGRPISFVTVAPEQARQAFLQMGASPEFADLYVEMYTGFGSGVRPAEPRTPETTTPTTLAQFAQDVLKPALQTPAGASA